MFPVLYRCSIYPQELGQLGLEQVQLQAAPSEVLPERFRGFRSPLGALPEVGVWASQDLDLQVTK